jgi:hypothetical protein
MATTNETKWTPGPYSEPAQYGKVGFEIIAQGRSIAIVNGIAEKRREYLESRKAALARREDAAASETREIIEIESSEAEALATAHLFRTATEMAEALRKADTLLREIEDAELAKTGRVGRLDLHTLGRVQMLIAVTSAALAKAEGR